VAASDKLLPPYMPTHNLIQSLDLRTRNDQTLLFLSAGCASVGHTVETKMSLFAYPQQYSKISKIFAKTFAKLRQW
jgi:hypothetical protein